jgi:hypothetical protein
VKLDVDTVPTTVPDAPPAAGPDRALDPPPPPAERLPDAVAGGAAAEAVALASAIAKPPTASARAVAPAAIDVESLCLLKIVGLRFTVDSPLHWGLGG